MDLTLGYQQTEAGVIPTDWISTTVREIASPIRNAIVGGPFGSDLVSADYVDSGVPVVRGQNMGRRFVSGEFAFVTAGKARSLEANLARPGDLIFTQRGTLGQVSLVPDHPYGQYLVSQSQMKLTVDRKIADSRFFYHVFSGAEQQGFIRLSTIQTGVPHINLGILRAIPVQRPSLGEQQAIAEALSDADSLIESLEQLLAKKRQLKQGAMQELLTGKRRLPGFIREWEVRALGAEVVALEAGVSVNSTDAGADLEPGNAAILKTSCVHRGVFRPGECKRILPKDVSRARLNPRADTILISRMNTIDLVGECGYVDSDYPYLFVPDRLWMTRFRKDAEVSARWLSYTLSSERYRDLLKAAATGTSGSMKNIAKGTLLSLEINFPPILEQTAIAAVLSDMDAEMAAMEAKLTKARSLKQGMMQELLTGRIRLV